MQKIPLLLTVLLTLLVLNSCSDSTSSGTAIPAVSVLTAEHSSVTMAVNYVRTIPVTGGNGQAHILALSDSSVMTVHIAGPYSMNGKLFQDVQIISKKTGIASVTVQDSAKRSEVQITVTVATMVTSPLTVRAGVGRSEYVSIMGGKTPYQIVTAPNSAVAAAELTTYSSMSVKGVSPGATSVTIRDNSDPFNSIEVPITVPGEARFIESGKVSFTSTVGNFSAAGISVGSLNTPILGGEGAGGWRNYSFYTGEMITIIAYRTKDLTKLDIVLISSLRNSLSAGTVPIDTSYDAYEKASVVFALNRDMNANSFDIYRLTGGTFTFTRLTSTSAAGTFSGNGVKYKDEVIISGGAFQLSDGMFDVPLMDETLTMSAPQHEDERIITILRGYHDREVARMMEQRGRSLNKDR